MLSIVTPSSIRKLADRFKDTQECSYGCLCVFFALHLFGCTSLCAAARCLAWSPSVSTLQRGVQQFSGTRFMKRLRGSVLRRLGNDLNSERFCYAIDDVPVEHFGKDIFRVGSWGGHGRGLMRGQRIMVLVLVDRKRGVALPLAYEVLTNTNSPGHRKATDVSFSLLELVLKAGFPKLPIVLDSWFDSVALMNSIHQRGVEFVIECKSTRKVKRSPAPGAAWKSWMDVLHKRIKRGIKLSGTENSKESRRVRYIAEDCVFIKGLKIKLKAAAMYNKPTDGGFFAVYVSNKLQMSGSEIWALSRARWHIEEAFRMLKQDFSFGKLPLQGEAGTDVSLCFSIGLLVSFQLERGLWVSRRSSVGSAVKEFREHCFRHFLDECASGSRRVTVFVLKTRRKVERNNRKPVNPTADEVFAWKVQAS